MNPIALVQGDITTLDVGAIVNAANSSLMGGGGVDGAIHRAGGPGILEECKAIVRRQGGCKPGQAVITSGGNLKAKYVIHTVGPVWRGGSSNEDTLLCDAYSNSLKIATTHGVKSIAFPNISTGVYGFPKKRAAELAIKVVQDFLRDNPVFESVVFCCFDSENLHIYKQILYPPDK